MVMRFGRKDNNENRNRINSVKEELPIHEEIIRPVGENYHMSFNDFAEVAENNEWDMIAKTYSNNNKVRCYFITSEGAIIYASFLDDCLSGIETYTNNGYNFRSE